MQDFVRKARISVAIVAKRLSGRVHIFRKSWLALWIWTRKPSSLTS
jgi:hypothetical protein